MIRILLLCGLSSLCVAVHAQRFSVGVFGGLADYNGDLTDRIYPKKVTNGAIGITGNYELTNNIILRGGLTYAVVGGADRYSRDPELVQRNLSFETSITEFSALIEYDLLDLYQHKFTPYVFAGLAIFHYNPYAYDANGAKVYLHPLSTEGEGIVGTGTGSYHLTQPAIPFGGGLKFALTDNIHLGVEVGLRKLFTDYLDDVSTNYADPALLLAAKGQQAVDMSYRGDELPNGSQIYPDKGSQRGGSKYKDFYYFTGIHLTFRLGVTSNGVSIFGGGNRHGRSRMGCPTNVN